MTGVELLRVHTEPFEDRFFFEILSAKEAMAFYGAASAPMRMAALVSRQRRHQPQGAPPRTLP
jgi:4-hydroxyphenylpyruvate dioxygenase-like putative hemolysin